MTDGQCAAWCERHRALGWVAATSVVLLYGALLFRAYPTGHEGSLVYLPTTPDDAYMYLRYADNLLDGKGFAWNSDGIQTYGVTSLPYLLAVTAARALHLSGGGLLMLLSWVFGGLFFVPVVLACRTVVKTRSLRSVTLLIVLCSAPVVWQAMTRTHALSGMDTTMSTLGNALLVLGVLSQLTQPSRRRFMLMCLAAYTSYVIRPDNLLYAVFVPTLGLLLLTPRRAEAVKFLAVLAALVLLDLATKRAIFGSALPLSAYVKQAGYYTGYAGARTWNPVAYLREFSLSILLYLGALVLLTRRHHARLLAVLLGPVALTFLYYFTVVQVMGQGARFYYPSLPFWIVSTVLILDDALANEFRGFQFRAVVPRILIAGALSVGLWGAMPRAANLYAEIVYGPWPDVGLRNRKLPLLGGRKAKEAVGRFASRLPTGTVMTATEVGFLGAAAPQVTIIDLAGLNDNELARRGFSMSYVLGRKPDVVWFPHYDYVSMIRSMLATDSFWRDYDYYCEAYDYGIAVRKDSRLRHALMDGLDRGWNEAYGGLAIPRCERQSVATPQRVF